MTNVSRRRNARRDQIPDRVGPLLPLYLDAVRAGRRRRTRARSPWRPPRDKQYRCRRTRRERVRPAAGRRSRPPVATLPAFAWGAKFSPRCRGPQGPAPVGRGPSGPLRTPRASAAPALLRLKLQRPLFGFHKTYTHSEINMFEHVSPQGFSLITSNCSECDNCVYQTNTDFHVFP